MRFAALLMTLCAALPPCAQLQAAEQAALPAAQATEATTNSAKPVAHATEPATKAAEPAAQVAGPAAHFTPPQRNYLIGCAGCHGLEGASNSKLVPRLRGLVGYYVNFPEARAYLPRLPNVAFSTMTDGELAAVLNFLVFDVGAGSAPRGAKPYSAAEVGKLRKQPLTEVALIRYRQQLVERLIHQYHASAELRVYGYDP